MKTFDNLKGAIEDVIIENNERQTVEFLNDELHKKIEHLRAVYALYFVEPEDDKEFEAWKSPLKE